MIHDETIKDDVRIQDKIPNDTTEQLKMNHRRFEHYKKLPPTAGKFVGTVSFFVRRRIDRQCVLRVQVRCPISRGFGLVQPKSAIDLFFCIAFNMVFRSALITATKRMAMVATSQVR